MTLQKNANEMCKQYYLCKSSYDSYLQKYDYNTTYTSDMFICDYTQKHVLETI